MVGTKVSTEVKRSGRKGRPNYPKDFKLSLAQQACEPGVSVSKLALSHGINANQLFKWRRHYRAGLFGTLSEQSGSLLPVSVIDCDEYKQATTSVRPDQPGAAAFIEVRLTDAVVRVSNGVEAETLRSVLELLRR